MRIPSILPLALGLVLAAPVSGQAAAPEAPAAGRSHRHSSRRAAATVVASFPGFRMNPDGTSRCFVHLSAPVNATTRSSGRRFEVLLPSVVVRIRNDLNVLETRFFDTPMLRAKLERRGPRDLAFVVELRADVTPTMHVDAAAGGGVDVVVELPAGHFATEPAAPGGYVRPSEEHEDSVRPAREDDAGARARPSDPGDRSPAPRQPEPPTGEDDERPPVFTH